MIAESPYTTNDIQYYHPYIGYNYDDLIIAPPIISAIKHRSECNVMYDGTLPIFIAPMPGILSTKNIDTFKNNHLIPIISRADNFSRNDEWTSISLDTAKKIATQELELDSNKWCIDIANGHMSKLYQICAKIKQLHPNVLLMVGNIANCETLLIADRAGVDYIRIGIGCGSQCITSSNVGIGFPQASLIDKCYRYKQARKLNVKLIADGGIKNYSDVIKALALGADYVMIGTLFASFYESAIPFMNTSLLQGKQLLYNASTEEEKRRLIKQFELQKEFFGASTKEVQQLFSKKKLHTSEGKTSVLDVKYTIQQWTENMIDYLKSAMSYCNCRTLEEFIGKQKLIVNYSRGYNM